MSISPSPILGQALRAAGYLYSTFGWVAHPERNNDEGLPKIPMTMGWQRLRLPWIDNLYGLDWQHGTGIGLILGPASGNLCAIDLDNESLATAAFEVCAPKTRCIRTISKHGHVYLIEETPSQSTSFAIEWRGAKVNIELKATGQQITCPCTPGYEHVGDRDQKPMLVPTIRYAWDALAARLGIAPPAGGTPPNAGYPHPWQDQVLEGDRNKALYVEAQHLRSASMPLEEALQILQVRWERSYELGGQAWPEVERTIRSAYRKPVWPGLEGGRDELNLLDQTRPL